MLVEKRFPSSVVLNVGGKVENLNNLNNLKIFLVPCGELECFIKDAGGHGPAWLNNVLENYPDLNSEEYKSAREFVSSWNL